MFGCKSFDGSVGFLHVEVGEAAKVIHKNSCACETLCSWVTFAMSDEARGRALELVDRHDVARMCGYLECGRAPFYAPGALDSFAKEAG